MDKIKTLSELKHTISHMAAMIRTCRDMGFEGILEDPKNCMSPYSIAMHLMETIVCDDLPEIDAEDYIIGIFNSKLLQMRQEVSH